MYSLHFYGQMIADAQRMEAYAAALRATVRPDSVVMDLGCGAGVFAVLACKLGARRVYAVEPENVIGLAREIVANNDCAVEFFDKLSIEITPPEPATIIISDLRGVLPWFEQHIPSIIDARTRLLARGGVLIPRRDILWAALVEAPAQYAELVAPWQKNKFGLDLSAGTRLITNNWRKTHIESEQFLAQPVCWTGIDYYEVESPDVHARVSWQAARNGTAHGVAVWFDSELVDGIHLSNHPAAPKMIYGVGLFPFTQPVEVKEGERIEFRLGADLVQDGYVWRWETDFPRASFKQSTFYGVPLSTAQLRKSAQ
jgi:type I protein arginine methyltransferase